MYKEYEQESHSMSKIYKTSKRERRRMTKKEGEENSQHNNNNVYLAAVECGGTSFVLSVGRVEEGLSPPFQVVWKESVETKEDPKETLKECADLLSRQPYTYAALGIATFGPVGLNRQDKGTYGRILSSSPKHHWRNVDLVTPLDRKSTRLNSSHP